MGNGTDRTPNQIMPFLKEKTLKECQIFVCSLPCCGSNTRKKQTQQPSHQQHCCKIQFPLSAVRALLHNTISMILVCVSHGFVFYRSQRALYKHIGVVAGFFQTQTMDRKGVKKAREETSQKREYREIRKSNKLWDCQRVIGL